MCAGFIEALGFPMKGPGWVGLSALLTGLPCWEGGRAAAVGGNAVAGAEDLHLSGFLYKYLVFHSLMPCLV